ncbi:MAG: SpoIIE family protein phosphatase, partial [Leptospiraceae bacterium]|nr:SpoIIE family protein phosphatase [Leptospiraceae bacterium]
ILEGINHFENFSFNDFELINVYSKTLSLLLKETFYSEEKVNQDDLFLKFSSSVLLLLHSTDNYRKNNRLEFLLEEVIRVSGLINTSRHLTYLLRDVMESVKSVFKTESCSILLVDKEKNDLYFHLVAGEKEEELTKIRVPMGKGIAGTVAVTKEPMIINDAQNDDRVFKVVDKTTGFVTRNILAAPLVVGDEVIGVVEAINTIDRNNFSESDIKLFLTFSDAAALAIQKTRLLDDLEKSNKELEKTVGELGSLFELGVAINESQTEEDLLLKSLNIIARELEATNAFFYLLDKSKTKLEVRSFDNQKYSSFSVPIPENSLISDCLQLNKVFMEDHFLNEKKSKFDPEYLNGSFVIIPLLFRNDEPFGVLSISNDKADFKYRQNQLRLLLTISAQFVKGYENLKLKEDMISKKAMEKEIEITRNIQNHILPFKKPGGSNFELGVKTVPAKEVSGDFYDFFKYDDGQFSFLIADVSGKSLPAAIFMAMSSSIIRTISRNHILTPAEMLFQANSLIYEDSQSGMFVTLFFIHYNPSNSEIEFASAGHNDQILIRADGSHEFIKGTGAPLGVIPTGKYVGGKFRVAIGDLIVLYTDGAIEEKNENDEEYGLDRFVEEIVSRKHLPVQQIIEEVYTDIREFSNSEEQFDDFTVLILKFNDEYQFQKTFPANRMQIPKLRDFLFDAIKVRNLSEKEFDDILLCCDEAATNIVMHSYKDTTLKNPTFECGVKFTENSIHILLRDKGLKFERESVPPPSLEANLKGERKGGFGVYLIEKLMDKVEYRVNGEYNEMLLIKNI